MNTQIWRLDLFDASLLYHFCLIVFNISLLFFEKIKNRKVKFIDDSKVILSSPFTYVAIFYPILFLISLYLSVGCLPILTAQNFVDQMYEYNYGPLYGYKFLIAYSFCLIFIKYKKASNKLLISSYILFLIFVVSVDGKRFMLLLSLLSIVPILMSVINKKVKTSEVSKFNKTPLIIAFSSIAVSYILINILRTGGDVIQSLNLMVEKIPFGVEYKDYVHSFNTYRPETIRNYSFLWSSIGSFLNSSVLELFDLNKTQLYNLGSQNAWKSMYNEDFGIRIGIIAELYFAYGLFVLPAMTIIAFFVNRISNRLLNPRSYFNLIQNSILFGLFFLLINGQATVFFGCLTMLIYVYILYSVSKYFIFKMNFI